jgi:Ni/Co efflux regulator RcnB
MFAKGIMKVVLVLGVMLGSLFMPVATDSTAQAKEPVRKELKELEKKHHKHVSKKKKKKKKHHAKKKKHHKKKKSVNARAAVA